MSDDELVERTDLVSNSKSGGTIESRESGTTYCDDGPFYSKVYEDSRGNLHTK